MLTFLTELVEKSNDSLGYITYVFKNLEFTDIYNKYIMCTQFPNWQHRILDVGEIGYLTFEERIAGDSKWFDGNSFHPYNYTCIQFIRFIEKQKTQENKTIKL